MSEKEINEPREANKNSPVYLTVIFALIAVIAVAYIVITMDYDKDFSKIYDGVMMDYSLNDNGKATATLEGTVTYSSIFSDEIVGADLKLIVKDSSGNVILDSFFNGTIGGENFNWRGMGFFVDHKDKLQMYMSTLLYGEDGLEKGILLNISDKDLYFVGPSEDINEAIAPRYANVV